MSKLRASQILVIGWVVFLLYAYPGYMTASAADQLVDSRTGSFTDWHPVMMSEVWRIVGRFVGGPSAMLFLQSWLLLGGAYFLLRRTVSDQAAAVIAVCLLLFPPVIATTAVIVPETQLACFVLAGMAAITSEKRWIRCFGLVLFVTACGMNRAAALAALPLLIARFAWSTERGARRIAIAAAAWCAVVLAAHGISSALVDAPSERPQILAAMDDIVGTVRYADLRPDDLSSLLAGAPLATNDPVELQRRAHAVYTKLGSYSNGDHRMFEVPTDAQREGLYAARRRIVKAAPKAYLSHRWHVWKMELGFGSLAGRFITDFLPHNGDPIQLQYSAYHSLVQRTLIRPVKWLSRTKLFRPHFYFFLAIALVIAAIVRRHRDVTVLLVSAIAYEVALMFVVTRPQFPDSLWLIVATLLAVIGFAIRELEARNERVLEQAHAGVAHEHGL